MFTHTLRVRWSEVDLQKVVFNGNYLNYFDIAITEFWRTTGLPSGLLQQATGAEMFVKKATVEYHAPAGFDELLHITVAPAQLGTTSVRFALNVWKDEPDATVGQDPRTRVVSGELVYVYVSTTDMRPTPWPEAWRVALSPAA